MLNPKTRVAIGNAQASGSKSQDSNDLISSNDKVGSEEAESIFGQKVMLSFLAATQPEVEHILLLNPLEIC
jgi:hypothetical protein